MAAETGPSTTALALAAAMPEKAATFRKEIYQQLISTEAPLVREAAARALAVQGADGENLLLSVMVTDQHAAALAAYAALLDATKDNSARWTPFWIYDNNATAINTIGADAAPILGTMLPNAAEQQQGIIELALSGLGPRAAGATEGIATMLIRTKDTGMQRGMLRLLTSIGPEAKEAIPAALSIVGNRSHTLRAEAATALKAMGVTPDPGHLEYLMYVAETASDPLDRQEAYEALAKLDRVPSVVIPLLQERFVSDTDNDVAAAAGKALANGGGTAWNVFKKQLGRRDHNTTFRLTASLGYLREPPEEAITYLILHMTSKDEAIASMASDSLVRIGREAIPPLLKSLNESSKADAAATVLGRIGPEALAQLKLQIHDPKWAVKHAAIKAIGMIGPQAAEVVPDLEAFLDQPDKYDQATVLRALGNIGTPARTAIPAMTRFAQDSREEIAVAAIDALGVVGSKGHQVICQLAENGTPRQKMLAMKQIQSRQIPLAISGDAIKAHYDQSNLDGQVQILVSLSKRTDEKTAVVDFFSQALGSTEVGVRLKAAELLGAMGADAVSAIPALTDARRRENGIYRAAFGDAIAAIRRAAK